MKSYERTLNQLSHLSQNRDKTPEELAILAKKLFDDNNLFSNIGFCVNNEEKIYARELLCYYNSLFDFEKESSKERLYQLIDYKINMKRYEASLKLIWGKNPILPIESIGQINKFRSKITEVLEQLELAKKIKEESNNYAGNIYIFKLGNLPHYKIGFSLDINERLKELQTANSLKLNVVKTIPGTYKLERFIHKHLEDTGCERLNGEWFELNEEQLSDLIIKMDKLKETQK
jgi:hypothetical protein